MKNSFTRLLFFIFFLFPLSTIHYHLTCIYAEDVEITTTYPSAYGVYERLRIQDLYSDSGFTNFTQSLTHAGINIITDYTDGSFTPGIFWSTVDDNNALTTEDAPGIPKAGIWIHETTAGTRLYFGTSNDYTTGITSAVVINEFANVGIGTDESREKMEITGNLRLPPATATTGKIIMRERADPMVHAFGIRSVYLGIFAGEDAQSTASDNTAAGPYALSNNRTGASNTACGYASQQGASAQNSGWNTSLGSSALTSSNNTYNSAFGAYVLNTGTGSHNTAIGRSAIRFNDNGNYNTALGYSALDTSGTEDSNTVAGASVLYSASGGSANSSNAVLGYAAGGASTYNRTVAVGMEAGGAGGTDSVVIGYQPGSTGTLASKLRIHNSNIVLTSTTGPLIYGDFVTDVVQIMGAVSGQGQLGIGTAPNTTYRLTLPNTASATDYGGKGIANDWVLSSSIRWKENITPIPNALEKVQKLRGVTYTRKDSKIKDIGMIAEEVGQVFPEIVDYEKNGTDAIGMSYDRLVAVLVEAMKELDVKSQAIEKKVMALEKK